MCIGPNESNQQGRGTSVNTPPTEEINGIIDDSIIEVEFPNLPVIRFNFPPMNGDNDDENADISDWMWEDMLSTTLMWLCPQNYTTLNEVHVNNRSTSFDWIELMQGRQEVSTYMEQSANFNHMLVHMSPIQVEIPGPMGVLQVFSGFFCLQVNPPLEE